MKREWLIALLLCAASGAHAAPETLTICYDYGCKVQAGISFDDNVFSGVGEIMRTANDAQSERYAISAAVAHMYVEAGKQTPIWHDRGGDFNDDAQEGSMDCIDHAANVTTFLKLMESRGLLRFHSVSVPVRRGFFAEHWAGQIIETGAHATYTVDSWFYDFGMPAIVMPLDEWQDGRRPPGIMAGFR